MGQEGLNYRDSLSLGPRRVSLHLCLVSSRAHTEVVRGTVDIRDFADKNNVAPGCALVTELDLLLFYLCKYRPFYTTTNRITLFSCVIQKLLPVISEMS